jgi:hypothetical protein
LALFVVVVVVVVKLVELPPPPHAVNDSEATKISMNVQDFIVRSIQNYSSWTTICSGSF